jgi:transcription-repair coupling factor (superfamily II helicase)
MTPQRGTGNLQRSKASVHALSSLTAAIPPVQFSAATQSPVSVLRLPLSATAGKQTWGNLPGAALSLAIAEAASAAGASPCC